MEKIIQGTIKKIEEGGFIEVLKGCRSIMARLDKLMELVPETRFWDPMKARRLVYGLQRKHVLDFGVCQFYSFENNEQVCSESGKKLLCLCAIPEAYCVFRDKDSGPKYPEFDFIRILEGLKTWSFW